MERRDYVGEAAELERRLDEHAPGVLEMLDTYSRSVPAADAQPLLNEAPVRHATGTGDELGRRSLRR